MHGVVLVVVFLVLLAGCGEPPSANDAKASQGTRKDSQAAPSKGTTARNDSDSVCTTRDFRCGAWGDSHSTITQKETAKKLADEPDIVIYDAEVGGLPAQAYYNFVEDKLASGSYVFHPEHVNANQFVDDYHALLGQLTDKYGKGKEREVWSDSLYRGDPEHVGMAVIAGHLTYITQWDLPATRLSLILAGNNFKATLGARYQSKKFEKSEEEKQRREKARAL